MSLTDFFGNIFTKKVVGAGLEAVFGEDEPNIPQIQYKMPTYEKFKMGLYPTSPAGKAKEIKISTNDISLAKWRKRLWGDDSYTNITLPGINI